MRDFERFLDGRTLIVTSNREPYEHVRDGDRIIVRQPAGGLVSALDPTLRRTRGVWVAWGSGSADRDVSDEHGRLGVPPDDPMYTLRRVWLDEADVDGYYLGFANSALWPLCHMLVQHYAFDVEQWARYRDVNSRFAAATADEAARSDGQPIVWVQDYHFALVPALVRAAAPSAFVHQFWHIPFPPADILGLLPTRVVESLLRGLLGNDLVEFHTERYAQNFLSCVGEFLPDVSVDRHAMTARADGRLVAAAAFPISIDVEEIERLARSPENEARARELRHRFVSGGRILGLSVDRLDYTKGIPERLRALRHLWTESDALRNRLTMIVIATPSRSELSAYRDVAAEVESLVREINDTFGTAEWTPIHLVRENLSADTLAGFYRAADLCLVSSLQDGMNLVAKEFVAAQVDECGVLVLSRFTGAAQEIEGAVLVNPFNVAGFANGIRAAIDMSPAERRERIHAMRVQLHRSTIYDWLSAILARVDAMTSHRADARTSAP